MEQKCCEYLDNVNNIILNGNSIINNANLLPLKANAIQNHEP